MNDGDDTIATIDLGRPAGGPPAPSPLHERFEDLGLLGIGGMGEVRRVRDTELDRVVAMKTLPAGAGAADNLSLLEEVRASAALEHPNIVPIYATGLHPDGRPWFTMREVQGSTLSEIIRDVHAASGQEWGTDPRGWSLRRLVHALLTACRAVAYAHEQGFVHCDLKPDNIMVGALGEVYVLDWGIASRHRSAERPRLAGTPSTMAPEQARGEAVDVRSDVYGLGAVLYTILTNRPPYLAFDTAEVLAMVIRGDRPALGSHGLPSPPAELVAVAERAMAHEPAMRFQTALALGDAVEAWLDDVHRRDRALAVMAQALEGVHEGAELMRRAAEARRASEVLLSTVAPWQPEADKAEGWRLADQALAAERQAKLLAIQVDHGLHGALRIFPSLPEAHRALSERYLARHKAAEADRDDDGMASAAWVLRTHLDALPTGDATRIRCEAYLQGDGALSLVTDPPGAEVELYRYEVRNRRMVPVLVGSLGLTPLVEAPLGMGSYLCLLRAPGRETVRYPIEVPRCGHWSGIRPGGSAPEPIWLPPEGLLGPDEIYVPAGWFHAGGDPVAFRSTPAQRLWCDGFVIDRLPATNTQYIAFLDDLVAQGREAEALQHAPRERSTGAGLGGLLYGRDADGRFVLQADGDGDMWAPDWPVFHLDWHGAAAYLSWRAQRSGRPWRLPGELEWEKAARGVDGRWYPWGDVLDPSFCCTSASHAGRALPRSVDSHPIDESPYGVRGMGGNIRDWCGDLDARVHHDQVMPPTPDALEGQDERAVRGGSWFDGPRSSRSTNRDRNVTGFRVPLNGVRGLWRLKG